MDTYFKQKHHKKVSSVQLRYINKRIAVQLDRVRKRANQVQFY